MARGGPLIGSAPRLWNPGDEFVRLVHRGFEPSTHRFAPTPDLIFFPVESFSTSRLCHRPSYG